MDTIIATILVTVLSTVAVIGLGAGIWAIVSLKRKVSALEGFRTDVGTRFDVVYREFENYDRKNNEIIKDVRNDMTREFDHIHNQIHQESKHIHDRIDDVMREFEKQLDKRFDNVYRKLPRINQEQPSQSAELLTD